MSAVFCPSVMCLPMDNLADSIRELDAAGVDRYHLDVMDGLFVPNYSLGLQDVEAVCRLTTKPCEVHLMTINPGQYVKKFADLGAKIIYIHPESYYVPSTVIQQIIDAGAVPGVVLNPSTTVSSIRDLLGIVKHVLVMTVNPGQAGQPFLPYVDEKIQLLSCLKKEHDFELGMDGACSPERIEKYYKLGVDSFVLGTAGLFHHKAPYTETMKELRCITGGESPPKSKLDITHFVTDVDGTLTDGKIYMGETGELMKAFDIKDGYAINELLPQHGIVPVILTGRTSQIVANRAKELHVQHVFQGVGDKLTLLKKFAKEQNIELSNIAYIGDDCNDLACMCACGMSACPADAASDVKKHAKYVTKLPAGSGAVREFVEKLIKEKAGE